MRTPLPPRLALCLILVSSLGLPVPLTQAADSPASLPQGSSEKPKLPVESLLTEIRETPYSKRAGLKEKLSLAEPRFNDVLRDYEAKKNALPEEERTAAEVDFKELVRQREVLRQKIDAVDFAEEATWNSARAELYVVLQNTVATYKKLRARFVK